ncbi:hypothetical protein GVX82_01310 [Patescibacteria group bacterium]|jgi:hypothetical protein|nr:hypothetical protein [Patescibacteria group bacterium]
MPLRSSLVSLETWKRAAYALAALAALGALALIPAFSLHADQDVPNWSYSGDSNVPYYEECNKFVGGGTMYRGYGMPYNFFRYDAEEERYRTSVNMRVFCDDPYTDNGDLEVIFGQSPRNVFTFERGYYWDRDAGRWEPLSVEPWDGFESGSWVGALGKADIPQEDLSYGEDTPNYVLGYICTYVNHDRIDVSSMDVEQGSWQCGCRDRQCAQNYWQLQEVTLEQPGAAPGSPEREEDHQAPVLQLDSDEDGTIDAYDNATFVANPDQRDTDGDGYGNVVDPDFNNDGVVDEDDQAYFEDAFGGTDPDADLNGDGSVNATDAATFADFFGGRGIPGPSYVYDWDEDGFGNVVDPDFNNDGVVGEDDQAYFEDAFGGTDPDADLNGDGFVNATDAAIVSKFIGYAPGPSYRTR